MPMPEDFSVAVNNFLQHPVKKVLLITADSTAELNRELQEQLSTKNNLLFHLDLAEQQNIQEFFNDLPLKQPIILIINRFGEDGKFENLYCKYNLAQWQVKLVVCVRKEIIQQLSDPSLYLAPLKGTRTQRQLLTTYELSATVSLNNPAVSEKAQVTDQPFFAKVDSFLNSKLMSNNPVILQSFANRVSSNPYFKDYLFKIIYASRQDATMSIAAANAITILNYARVSFAGMNLSGIRIPGADLSEAMIDHANLSNADLSYVNFTKAAITKTNLESSLMLGTKWGEKPFFRQARNIKSIDITPDSKFLVACSKNTAWVWRKNNNDYVLVTAVRCTEDETQQREFTYTAIDSQEKRVVTGSRNGVIRLWDISTATCVKLFKLHTADIIKVYFIPNQPYIVSLSSDKTIRLWNRNNDTDVLIATLENNNNCLCISLDGKLLAYSNQNNVFICEITRLQETHLRLDTEMSEISDMQFSPDRRNLAIAGKHKSRSRIVFYALDSYREQHTLSIPESEKNIQHFVYSPDNQQLAIAFNDQTAQLWDIDATKAKRSFEGHNGNITAVRFCNDQKTLITAGEDSIRVWELDNVFNNTIATKHYTNVRALKFSQNGRLFAIAYGQEVYLLETVQFQQVFVFHQLANVRSICFSHDGSMLAVLSNNEIKIYNAKNGLYLRSLEFPSSPFYQGLENCRNFYFINNDTHIITVDANTLCLWNLADGSLSSRLEVHEHRIEALSYQVQTQRLASACSHEICIWDIQTRSLIITIPVTYEVTSICLSADGKRLLVGYKTQGLYLFQLDNISAPRKINNSLQHIIDIKFSPSQEYFVAIDRSGKIFFCTIREPWKGYLINTSYSFHAQIDFDNNDNLAAICHHDIVKVWQISEKLPELLFRMRWSSRPLLSCNQTMLENAKELSPEQRDLLFQGGAIGLPQPTQATLIPEQFNNAPKLPQVKKWNLPIPDEESFGREDVLNKLNEYFNADNQCQQLVYLFGDHGCGKSHLVKRYINETNNYTLRCWFSARSIRQLEIEYTNLGESMGLLSPLMTRDVAIRTVREWFENNTEWIIHFDGCKNIDSLQRFIPRKNGHIIISTTKQCSTSNYITVGPLDRDAAKKLFNSGTDGIAEDQKVKLAILFRFLYEIYHGSPLAIDLGGRFISFVETSADIYYEYFNYALKKVRRCYPQLLGENLQEVKYTLYVAIEINVRALFLKDREIYDVLCYLVLLEPYNIPYSIINSIFFHLFQHDPTPEEFEKLTKALCNSGICTVNTENESLLINPIAHKYMQRRMPLMKKYRCRFVLVKLIGDTLAEIKNHLLAQSYHINPKRLQESRAYLPHMLYLWQACAGKTLTRDQKLSVVIFLYYVSNLALITGDKLLGRTLLDQTRKYFNSINNLRASELFCARYLVEGYMAFSLHDEACECILSILNLIKIIHGVRPKQLLWFYEALANVYQSMGKFSEQIETLNQAIILFETHRRKKTTSEDAELYMSMGTAQLRQGNLAVSLRYFEAAYDMFDINNTQDIYNSKLFFILENLAGGYTSFDQPEKAIRLLERHQNVISSPHPAGANLLNLLAEAHRALGHLAQSISLLERGIAAQRKSIPASFITPGLALMHIRLSQLYAQLGNRPKAYEIIDVVLQSLPQLSKMMPGSEVLVYDKLYDGYISLKDYKKAKGAVKRTLNSDIPTMGPFAFFMQVEKYNLKDLSRGLHKLGKCYLALGKIEKAKKVFFDVLAVLKEKCNPQHPRFIDIYKDLAEVCRKEKNYQDEIIYLQLIIAIEETNHGRQHGSLNYYYLLLRTAEDAAKAVDADNTIPRLTG